MPRCNCGHGPCAGQAHPQRSGEAVGYVYTHEVMTHRVTGYAPPRRPILVKKSSYPASCSLTQREYRACMLGKFEGLTVVSTFNGDKLLVTNSIGLRDLVSDAEAHVARNGDVYFVVRW